MVAEVAEILACPVSRSLEDRRTIRNSFIPMGTDDITLRGMLLCPDDLWMNRLTLVS